VAGSAGDQRVPHAPSAYRSFPGRPADARLLVHLRFWSVRLRAVNCGSGVAAIRQLGAELIGLPFRNGAYWPVAAPNLMTSSAGTRLRLISMPRALAQSWTSVAFSPLAAARRALAAGHLPWPAARR
jgi:hypothetical protein